MTLRDIYITGVRKASAHSPAILTGVAVAGSLTTAFLTGTATFKAAEIIRKDRELEKLHPTLTFETPTLKSDFKLVWKEYVPAAGVFLLTASCMIMATRIGSRRAAAVVTAYGVLEHGFTEYRDKIVETIGEKKETEIRDELAKDRLLRASQPAFAMTIPQGLVPCYEATTDRWWPCSMEILNRAENDINFQLIHHDTATVTDFYNLVGLNQTSDSDYMGWNSDKKLNLHKAAQIATEGPYKDMPVIVVDFATVPHPDHWRFV